MLFDGTELRRLFGTRRRRLWTLAIIFTSIHACVFLAYNICSAINTNHEYEKKYSAKYSHLLLIATIAERVAYFGMYLVSIFLTVTGFGKRIRLQSGALPIYLIFFLNEGVSMMFEAIMGDFTASNLGFGLGILVTSSMGKVPCPCCGMEFWVA
ncbi:unnamed protein product, partial [Mesorhabditis spiculigera]